MPRDVPRYRVTRRFRYADTWRPKISARSHFGNPDQPPTTWHVCARGCTNHRSVGSGQHRYSIPLAAPQQSSGKGKFQLQIEQGKTTPFLRESGHRHAQTFVATLELAPGNHHVTIHIACTRDMIYLHREIDEFTRPHPNANTDADRSPCPDSTIRENPGHSPRKAQMLIARP